MWKLKFPLNIEARLNSVRLLGCGGDLTGGAASCSNLENVILIWQMEMLKIQYEFGKCNFNLAKVI